MTVQRQDHHIVLDLQGRIIRKFLSEKVQEYRWIFLYVYIHTYLYFVLIANLCTV